MNVSRLSVVSMSVLLASGCQTVRVAKPDPIRATVDFAVLIESQNRKGSALNNPEAGMMRRVLLTPSLVFESSRSSAIEPGVIGPPDGKEVELGDALGRRVDFRYSTELIRYLTKKQSTLLVPAISKRWDPRTNNFWLNPSISDLTWIERLMQASVDPAQYKSFMQEVPAGDEKDKDKTKTVRVVVPAVAPNASDLPTAALAARSLGLTINRIPVVVVENPQTGIIEVRQRYTARQSSMCSPKMEVPVPSVSFQAEFVSIRDGRLLARIDDIRAVKTPQFMQQSIDMTEPRAVYRGRSIVEWNQATTRCDGAECTPVVCQSIEDAVSRLIEDLAINGGPRITKALSEIFSENLDVLYQN